MQPIETFAILITLAALFSYLNHRFLKLPMTVGLMLISLLVSLALLGLNGTRLDTSDFIQSLMLSIDFERILMGFLLGLLLFAGALHVNINDLILNHTTGHRPNDKSELRANWTAKREPYPCPDKAA